MPLDINRPERPPIVLLVYARPDHLDLSLQALAANEGAADSRLIIFSDAAQGTHDRKAVEAVRHLIQGFNWPGEKIIHLREFNHGLYKNVTTALDHVFDEHSMAIILEDDLICSPHFLSYCHKGLEQYRSELNVWSINGYQFELKVASGSPFLSSLATSSWGWASWADRWKRFRLEYREEDLLRNKELLKRMNFGGYPFSEMLNNPNSWAIRWYAFVQSKGGTGLFPRTSMVANIGFDGSGVHSHSFDVVPVAATMPEMKKQLQVDKRLEQKQKEALSAHRPSRFIDKLRQKIGV